MNHRRPLFLLGGLIVLAGLAALAFRLPSAPGASVSVNAHRLSSVDLNLQCHIKVPGGLAQCGTQASSCKNCHEVKGEDPVNAKGDWHISHAFADFCEFCHGGNVQAPEKDAAHQGLVEPLGDLKTNCSTCHNDYEALAQAYAATLGVKIGAGGGPTSGGSSEPAATAQPDTDSSGSNPDLDTPPGGEIVDYVSQYTDYVSQHTTGSATPAGAGNVVVGGLLALTVAGGGAFVYWNEKRLRKSHSPSPVTASRAIVAANEPGVFGLEISGELSPELAKLLPVLRSLDPRTLQALRIILSDRRRGEELLQSLSLVNFAVLDEMKRLDKRDLSLLLALAGES